MEHIEGYVEAISSNKPNQYGLMINGEWYNGYGSKPEHLKDKYISCGYEANGKFRNIKSTVELMTPALDRTPPSMKVHEEMIHDPKPTTRHRSKCKMHAIKGATIEYLAEQYNSFGAEQEVVASQIIGEAGNLMLFMYYKA